MKLKAVIVEDEQASRETLRNYLEKYCPDVTVLGEAESVKSGIKAIKEHSPDVVFLDVEMPFGNAFDLLEQVDEINFETIFVTAYSHYAMKALNFSAAYYILKPIDIDELIAAVERVKVEREANAYAFHTQVLVENIQTVNKQLHKVVLPLLDGFEVVKVQEIVRCQGNDNFTDFHLTNGNKMVICRTLKFYEELLTDFDFLRVHKSHLINMQHVKSYKKGKGGMVVMSNGSAVDVSPTKKALFMDRF